MNYNEWALNDVEYTYLQLANKFRNAIFCDKLKSGENLPSIRKLAKLFKINPSTVAKAYRILNKEGLIIRFSGGSYMISLNQSYIQKVRNEILSASCVGFIVNMKQNGASSEEIITMIERYLPNGY